MPMVAALDADAEAGFLAHNWPVERVTLDGFAAGFADEPDEFVAAHSLRSSGSGVVINLLYDDGAIDIVSAETQGDLRDLRLQHLPISLDVGEVIEHQP